MANTPRLVDLRKPPPSPVTAAIGDGQRAVRPHQWQPAANRCRRCNRSVGFWLGGFLLGVSGCILGWCMPYRHPVAVTISVLWWGTYLGCFGAGIGALLGLWVEQTPAPPSQGSRGNGGE
jgi:hypothetical protein